MSDRQFATALYGRTSKDDPKRVTIEIQQKGLREWAGRDPLVSSVAGEFWDDGVTGKLPLWERPAGRALLDEVRAGRVQCVAVIFADRFGRTLLDGLQAVKVLTEHGAKLVAVNDGWDGRRDDNPLFFQFRMMMAEEEHRRISQRMAGGKARAMDRDNAPPGGPLTFGYRMDDRGHYTIDPAEAAVVIRLFEMAVKGVSHAEMLRWVKGQGVPAGRKFQKRAPGSEAKLCENHKAAAWHLTKVGKILRNRTYLGERRWGDRTFPCAALVDAETFERVQVLCEDKSRRFGIGKFDPTKGLLSGLLTCAHCGSPYYHKATVTYRQNGSADRYQMYVCDNMRRARGCNAKMLRVDALDADVWATVEEFLANPEALVRKVIANDRHLSGQAGELHAEEKALTDELESIDSQAGDVWSQQKEHGWPLSWVAPRLDELMAARERALGRLGDVRRRLAALTLTQEESGAVAAALAGIRAQLAEGLSPEKKYHILRLMVAGGTVETKGRGRHKTADVRLQLRWGEALSAAPAARKLPKDCSYGTTGEAGFALSFTVGRAG